MTATATEHLQRSSSCFLISSLFTASSAARLFSSALLGLPVLTFGGASSGFLFFSAPAFCLRRTRSLILLGTGAPILTVVRRRSGCRRLAAAARSRFVIRVEVLLEPLEHQVDFLELFFDISLSIYIGHSVWMPDEDQFAITAFYRLKRGTGLEAQCAISLVDFVHHWKIALCRSLIRANSASALREISHHGGAGSWVSVGSATWAPGPSRLSIESIKPVTIESQA